VYAWVARIPFGQVATYGQIATLSGYPGRARQVGFALAGMPDGLDLPWHRVINAQGKVSPRTGTCFHELQYALLEREGIPIIDNRIDLNRYRWQPEDSGPRTIGVEEETSE
jgi:methylated-DNA-protein-cysteine methyltransferase-like protein